MCFSACRCCWPQSHRFLRNGDPHYLLNRSCRGYKARAGFPSFSHSRRMREWLNFVKKVPEIGCPQLICDVPGHRELINVPLFLCRPCPSPRVSSCLTLGLAHLGDGDSHSQLHQGQQIIYKHGSSIQLCTHNAHP